MNEPPVRLLSIDGGGVRGLSALVLLEQLMEHVNDQRESQGLQKQEPWELFDLMGGTSTGGLIAILLGRLRMPLDQAIDAYIRLSGKAFTMRNLLSRAGHKVTLGAKFKTGPLEDAIHEMIGGDSATKLLKEDMSEGGRPCKVFVMSHLQDMNEAVVLRSYRNLKSARATYDSMLIWQVARATSAALTYFDPITIDHLTYSDGGLYYNNPISLVHSEASQVFRNRKQIIVSLGTGKLITMAWDPSLLTIAQGLARIATETENEANSFYRRDNGKMARELRYFRFNVPELGEKDLAESDPGSLANIRAMTEKYLNDAEVGDKVESCADNLAEAKRHLPGFDVDQETKLAYPAFGQQVPITSPSPFQHRQSQIPPDLPKEPAECGSSTEPIEETPVALLALDGGGIRGVIGAIILYRLMSLVQERMELDEEPLPKDYFHMIGGSGTGGLLVIMLGRLGMSARASTYEYAELSQKIFQEDNRKSRIKADLFKATTLENAIQHVTPTSKTDRDGKTPLRYRGGDPSCKSFVLCLRSRTKVVTYLRTYRPANELPNIDCTVWEAARATTAVPSIFKPIKITGLDGKPEECIGPGLGHSNPTQELLEEASRVYGQQTRVKCVLSIGNGKLPGVHEMPSDLLRIVDNISADCEATHQEVAGRFEFRGQNSQEQFYFRLDLGQEAELVSLQDWDQLSYLSNEVIYRLEDKSLEVNNLVDLLCDRSAKRKYPTFKDLGY